MFFIFPRKKHYDGPQKIPDCTRYIIVCQAALKLGGIVVE